MTPSKLHDFLAESNRIEGIKETPSREQHDAAMKFMRDIFPDVRALERLVAVIQPGARLRDKAGMNVRVGAHHPPGGGPKIRVELDSLVFRLLSSDPYEWHREYERLHPFTDGNGRSGRLCWLWQMERRTPGGLQRLGFLHAWYYQSLGVKAR